MKHAASLLAHLRDIMLLPVTMTIVIPYLIDKPEESPSALIRIIGIVIMLGGITLFTYTVMLFKVIGRGTLAPWSTKQRLVVTGPYRYCRNPMITGVFFVLTGETIFFWSSALLTYTLLFFLINTVYFILVEEPGLEERFGGEYNEYKIHVPRWLPRVKPYFHL